MSTRLFSISIALVAAAWILYAQDAAPAPSNPASQCVGCHSFDKVIEASAAYKTPSGEKANPHRYVPHNSKKDEDIPDCTHCHAAHPQDPLPVHGSIDLTKVSVTWCYDACHHEKNFTSCKNCHP